MKTKSWLERVLHMWPVKVLSIAAAVLLFFFTNLVNLENRVVTLPIHYLLAPGFTQAADYPTKARVRLRGNAEKIFGILEEDLAVSADYRKFDREGQFQVPLSIRRTGAAATVEPLDITVEPGMVTLNIEHSQSRELPVNVRFSGSPKPGFQMVSHVLSPEKIMVTGPASRVQLLHALETETVDLSPHSEDFSQKVRTFSPDNLVKTVGQDNLDLRVNIGHAVNKRNFTGIPLSVIGLSPDLSYVTNLPNGNVTIQADSSELEKLSNEQIRVLVDASQIRSAGIFQLKTICDAPPRSLVLSIDPVTITLVVNQNQIAPANQ